MPHEEDKLTPAERELEAALAGLTPAGPGFGVGHVETRALVARERRRTHAWQAVAALLAVAAGVGFWSKPAPRVVEVERVVSRERERPADARWVSGEAPAASPNRPPGDYAYLRLRERVLAEGVESLRASRGSQAPRAIEAGGAGRGSRVEVPTLAEYLFAGGRS